jgi:Mg2+ and Co2+ transporter CorA
MAVIALFYRATLLDFSERTALVSRRLFNDSESGKLSTDNIQLASDLRSEFLHFANYWYFDELANKDEEQEHFELQSNQYRIGAMKHQVDDEIEKLSASLHNYYQFRNTESINRLAMLSLILGAGAVATGFFGMNFGREFSKVFFDPADDQQALHWVAIAFVTAMSLGTISFGAFVVLSNWSDYRDSLIPRSLRRDKPPPGSLRRGG